jgi:hypothetical protein
MVVAKVAGADGSVLWVREMGAGYNAATAVAVSASGTVLLTGNTVAGLDLGGGPVSQGGPFVAAYATQDGSFRWAQVVSGGSANGVAVDPTSGNVVVTGNLTMPASFGTDTTASGGVFLASYDASGKNLWAKTFNNLIVQPNANDVGAGVSVDGHGNIALCGTKASPMNFGGGWLSGGARFFVASFTSTGAYRWANVAAPVSGTPTVSTSSSFAVTSDALGRVIGTGTFTGSITVGADTFSVAEPATAPLIAVYGD